MRRQDLQNHQLEYLNKVLSERDWKPTELARHCKLSPSTFSHFLNRKRNGQVLRLSTVQSIERVSGIQFKSDLTGSTEKFTVTAAAEDQLTRIAHRLESIESSNPHLRTRLTWVEEGIVGFNKRLDSIEERLERIERRLGLAEASH